MQCDSRCPVSARNRGLRSQEAFSEVGLAAPRLLGNVLPHEVTSFFVKVSERLAIVATFIYLIWIDCACRICRLTLGYLPKLRPNVR